MKRTDVLIVVPPFASAEYPALGPDTLAAACRERGIGCEVYYANVKLACRIGFPLYEEICWSSYVHLVGDMLFSQTAFHDDPSEEDLCNAVRTFLRGQPEGVAREEALLTLAPRLKRFLKKCVGEILDLEPRIIGFSSMFQQTLAALSLARRVKAAAPEILTVLGGANASRPMGPAVASLAPVFDFVFSGEADIEFPAFCADHLEKGRTPNDRIVECAPVRDMDALPVPQNNDYLLQLEKEMGGSLPEGLPRVLMFESSRGCWYGEKRQCTFCGLNGLALPHRRKSAGRVAGEIKTLSRPDRIRKLAAADNIMPREWISDLLPLLSGKPDLFWEVKPNHDEKELDLFARAGVTDISAGIESLSTHVQELMAKGVDARRCLRLLRDCAARGIHVGWNLLYGFPEETEADYAAMLDLLPWIDHLQPPLAVGRIRIDRHSLHHARPGEFGITPLSPVPAYRQIYPEGAPIDEIAFTFTGGYETPFTRNQALVDRLHGQVGRWKYRWEPGREPPRLTGTPLRDGGLLVEDTRKAASKRYHVLDAEASGLLRRLDRPLRCDRLEEPDREIVAALSDPCLVVKYEDHFLNLVVLPKTP